MPRHCGNWRNGCVKGDKYLAGIACCFLSLALLLTVVDLCCFRVSFYKAEYQKNNAQAYTGMSEEDNLRATVTLLDYLRNLRDDIVVEAEVNGVRREVFNERETLHMVDVKALYQKAILFRNTAVVIGQAIVLYLLFRKKRTIRGILLDGFVPGNSALFAAVAAIGIWALADFDRFWTNFHLLFFDNDLWLLDPRTSIMINLFPGSFFFDLVIQIILVYLAVLIAVAVFTYYPIWRKK